MKRIFIDPDNIDYTLVRDVAAAISEGQIVALPTDTVYGLAAAAGQKSAVEKLSELKQRADNKPFTIALAETYDALTHYFMPLTPFGYRLIEKFWPGPLTIIYYALKDGKIGIRVPAHLVAQAVLKIAGAVYLPSANISGEREAVSADDVEAAFDGKLAFIVDSGLSLQRQASTVIDLTSGPFTIVRPGVVSEREIVEVFSRKRILFVCTGNTCRSPMAQFLLQKYLQETKPYFEYRYEVISRGVSALNGAPASPFVMSLLKNNEAIDVKNFFSRRLERRDILSSDFIFTMKDAHTDYILNLEPTVEGRIFTLKKFLPADLERDIPDPIGGNYEEYENVYSLIKQAVIELKEWI